MPSRAALVADAAVCYALTSNFLFVCNAPLATNGPIREFLNEVGIDGLGETAGELLLLFAALKGTKQFVLIAGMVFWRIPSL